MHKRELFELPRKELMARAEAARIQAPQRMTNRQMIHAIQVAQTKYKLGSPYFSPENLYIPASGKRSFIGIENPTKQTMHLRLELVGRRNVFEIPTDRCQITIDSKKRVKIPVSFHVQPTGVMMTCSAKYRAAIRVWDEQANLLVDEILLTGLGPRYVNREYLNCLSPAVLQVDPPFSVAIFAEDAESDLPLPVPIRNIDLGHKVRIRWSLSGARWYSLLESFQFEEILTPGTFPESITIEGPTVRVDPTEQIEGSFETRIYKSTAFTIFAGEIEDPMVSGQSATATVNIKIPVYYDAWTPANVWEDDLERIGGYFERIDRALRQGCIRNCATLAHRFSDQAFLGYLKPSESFEDEYTEDTDLTHDILVKMREVPIAIGRDSLVAMGEPRADLCRCTGVESECDICVYGFCPDRRYIAICAVAPGPKSSLRDNPDACVVEGEATDYALIHELVHYSTKDILGEHEEEVAEEITDCYWRSR